MKTHTRLKVWMLQQGKRQQEFADSLGIHRETLNAIVNGRKLPGDPVAILIEKITGIPAWDW